VRAWRQYAPQYLPLPHPSPRNNLWFKRNAFFADEVVPALQQRVGELLS
jgi:uracil-DNA glycosylase